MAELLLFQLVAPLGAFGGIAVGERRETAARPSHSALAGCLGAALGMERADSRQASFAAGLAFAVRCDHLGPLLADYHTAQTPPARKGKTWATRREELAGEVNTILSRRDYRSDCAFTIACLAMPEIIVPLRDIAAALRRPFFTLYLGRKSCPLGLPPDPLVTEATTLEAAFADYDRFREKRRPAFDWAGSAGEISIDGAFIKRGLAGRDEVARVEKRRDVVVDRRGWRFDLRDESILSRGGARGSEAR
ncbi:MAG: type I-E CRISPR-associated protein Cas5/CasD [Methylocystis sp.]